MGIKNLFKFVVLPIVSGIVLLHITTLIVITNLGFPLVLFRAIEILCLVLMWLYGLNELNRQKRTMGGSQ